MYPKYTFHVPTRQMWSRASTPVYRALSKHPRAMFQPQPGENNAPKRGQEHGRTDRSQFR